MKPVVLALAIFLFTIRPGLAADPVVGHQLFLSSCNMCHPGGENVLNPDKPLKGPIFIKRFPTDASIVALVRTGIPKTVMTPFTTQRLSDRQLADIIAYMRTLTPACPKDKPKAGAPVKSGKIQTKKGMSKDVGHKTGSH